MTRAAPAAAAVAACLLAVHPAAAACRADLVEARVGDRTLAFSVEIADTPEERARGLMFRTELARDAGMLFLFDDVAPRAFWMKNTPLPLDIVYIDGRGVVCSVVADTTPYSTEPLPSGCPARATLELNAGVARASGVAPGVALRHPAFGPGAAWPCDPG